jgi:hypothetical protein
MPHAKVPIVPLLHRLCWSPAELAALTGLSISFIYNKIKDGTLPSKKVNGRRIINHVDGKELIGLGREHIGPIDEIAAGLAAPPSAPEASSASPQRDYRQRPTPTGPRPPISPRSQCTTRGPRATGVAAASTGAVGDENSTAAMTDS